MTQGNLIKCVTSTKCLGIIIDNKLKWNEHIMYGKQNFKINRPYLDKSALRNMFYTFIF